MQLVEDFIAMVSVADPPWLSLQWLRDRHREKMAVTAEPAHSPITLSVEQPLNIEQLLVSSPGFGVLDSGCGRSIIGATTLQEFEALWQDKGWKIPIPFAETNHFKFGNGQKETTQLAVQVPVRLGGRVGTVKAAIVKGSAPLLISRNALKTLKAVIDFEASSMTVFDERITVPLYTNQAGQFTVDLLGDQDMNLEPFAEVMNLEPTVEPNVLTPPAHESPAAPPTLAKSSSDAEAVQSRLDPQPGEESLMSWSREDHFLRHVPSIGKQGPLWSPVRRRIVTDMDTHAASHF